MPKRQNLIIICADELRGDCVGYAGNTDVRTPNIDSLASSGVAFLNHFAVYPKCTPSRVSLMTGRYTHTDGYRALPIHLGPKQPDLLSTLKSLDYVTAVFGKNHCWDEGRWNAMDHRGDRSPYTDGVSRPGGPTFRSHEPMPLGWDYAGARDVRSGDRVNATSAARFLTETRDRSRPFFMQFNIESPHPPYGVIEPFFSMADRQSLKTFPTDIPKNAPLCVRAQRECRTGVAIDPSHAREVQATYYGMIAEVDSHVGKVMSALEASGERDNTVVLFWSDHGDYAGQYGLAEKWDTHFADCLTHVPCIIRAPQWHAGQRVEHLSDHTDLCPTLASLLGIKLPFGVHGRCLEPTLQGQPVRDAVFSEGGHEKAIVDQARDHIGKWMVPEEEKGKGFPKNKTYYAHPESMLRSRMIRTHQHKLVVRQTGDNEFYDLCDDPWELDNRIADPATAADQLRLFERLARWGLETDPDSPPITSIGA